MTTNNKFWSWSEKQLRKQRSINSRTWPNAPRWYRKHFNVASRQLNKKAICEELKGSDGIFQRRTERHAANWDWS